MSIKMNIVSVDDNTVNLLLIEALTKDLGMNIKSFTSAEAALEFIENGNPADIILTDYMMPDMHGVDFIKLIRTTNSEIPIVMITAVTDDNVLKIKALEEGATEFLNKPLNPTEFKARLNNLANLRKAQLLLKDRALLLEEEVRKSVRVIEEREHEALFVLGRASDYKDPETGLHISRVAAYSVLIVKAMGGSIAEQEIMFHAAPLHDIGKIGIPDEILLKPGKYTSEEYDIMQKHPLIGYEMLKTAKSSYLRKGAEIALSHHEKYNGTGYPNKLKGEEIPLSGRILAVADVFDALTTERPYKKAWSVEDAIGLLEREKGQHFDPKIVDIFIQHIDDVKKIYLSQQEQPGGLGSIINNND